MDIKLDLVIITFRRVCTCKGRRQITDVCNTASSWLDLLLLPLRENRIRHEARQKRVAVLQGATENRQLTPEHRSVWRRSYA